MTVGFNRRFSDLSKILKEKTNGFPVYISIDINAGSLPFDHWTLDRDVGGGRLLGEVCHFIDLALYITDKKIISVSCNSSKTNDPSYFLTINFVGGSIANIRYLTNGFTNNIKEIISVNQSDSTYQIIDWKVLKRNNKVLKKYSSQNKGHSNMIKYFLKRKK